MMIYAFLWKVDTPSGFPRSLTQPIIWFSVYMHVD